MPDYFLSDVHLRLDEPDRGRRLARLVDRLGPEDSLTIVGDLCDFWYAARQYRADPMRVRRALAALASFRRRGGSITILAGNHDAWIGPFYERTLGARFLPDTLEVEIQGLRIYLAHGHRLGAHTPVEGGPQEPGLPGRLPRGPRADRRRPGRPAPADQPAGIRRPSIAGGWRSIGGSPAGSPGPTTWSSWATSTARSTPARPPRGWSSWGDGINTTCYLVLERGVARHVIEPGPIDRAERPGTDPAVSSPEGVAKPRHRDNNHADVRPEHLEPHETISH